MNKPSAPPMDIHVEVDSDYLPQQSVPEKNQYAFAYQVVIHNRGSQAATLRRRHWVVVDGNQVRREVEGEGVVGQQPTIEPGDSFSYTSAVVLDTPVGSMHGDYQMETHDGRSFAAAIAAFSLAVPHAVH
jgi:ApaG protein